MGIVSSQRIRAYFPAMRARTTALWADGIAVDAPRDAYTVSDAERAAGRADNRAGKTDEEALEYQAFLRAATAAAGNDASMVISADVAPGDIDTDGRLVRDVVPSAVVSFHVGADLLWYDVSEAADILQ